MFVKTVFLFKIYMYVECAYCDHILTDKMGVLLKLVIM